MSIKYNTSHWFFTRFVLKKKYRNFYKFDSTIRAKTSPHLFASNSLLKREGKKKNGPFLPKLQGKPFVRGVFFVKNFPFPHVNHKFGHEPRHIASGTIARSMTRWQKVHFEGASLSSSSSPPPLPCLRLSPPPYIDDKPRAKKVQFLWSPRNADIIDSGCERRKETVPGEAIKGSRSSLDPIESWKSVERAPKARAKKERARERERNRNERETRFPFPPSPPLSFRLSHFLFDHTSRRKKAFKLLPTYGPLLSRCVNFTS